MLLLHACAQGLEDYRTEKGNAIQRMINNHDRVVTRGLRDVAAAETKISFVDPMGTLYYLGYNIDDLVEHVCYEEVVYLLLHGELPTETS